MSLVFLYRMTSLFPYDAIRPQQDLLIDAVSRAVNNKGQLVVHAPTGLGKTAGALAPAIEYALQNEKTVIFVTSRHTQHELALKTVQSIKEKHNIKIFSANLVGKKHYCLQPGAERLRSREFTEYCKALREDKSCEYYENVKVGEELSPKMKLSLMEAKELQTSEQMKSACSKNGVCPYEVAIRLTKDAHVIITDYNYLFNPGVASSFMQRIDKELKDCIIVVDEAHNLPDRVKESASDRLTSTMLQRAFSEAEKFEFDEHARKIQQISDLFGRLGLTIEEYQEERFLDKEDFVRKIDDYETFMKQLEAAGDVVREEQQYSYLGAVADFMRIWFEGDDDGFTRIFSENSFNDKTIYTLSYRCLDPSVVTGQVITQAHASVMMSGTLSPTRMYKELLGALRAEELTLQSPFPQSNKLALIVPKTSTKFTQRSEAMYAEIGSHCTKIANKVPGNVAIFFPSYALLTNVSKNMRGLTKTVFTERSGMTREEKHEFLERFKQYKEDGAVLLGVISGSFGEGVDLPGDLLRGVVVVGLPLGKPDLETKALINYFDNKYGRGWDYGYTFPAFNKTMQSAGRCIRTENDRGVIVFLDERYANEQYKRCFPDDWDVKTTILYEGLIGRFFNGA